MRLVAPAGDVYQAGTLSGNPLATAAGLATLRLLDADAYARLRRDHERLAEGLAALDERISVVSRQGLVTPFFRAEPPRDYDGAKQSRRRGLRGVRARPARARRLPAGLPVRGLVPVARPHRRARRADARGRRSRHYPSCERPRRGPAAGRARGRRPRRRRRRRPLRRLRPGGCPRGLPPALRGAAAASPGWTRIWPCLQAIRSTRWAWRGWPRQGDLERRRDAGRPDHGVCEGSRRGRPALRQLNLWSETSR